MMSLQNFQFFFQPGIYLIKNNINGKTYHGQTINIALRFAQHYGELIANVHENKALQEDWRVFGSEAFNWSIIEIGNQWQELDKRLEQEKELISKHKHSTYNFPQKNEKPLKTARGMAVFVGGFYYASIAQAAKFHGISIWKARQLIDTNQNHWRFVNPEQVAKQKVKATSNSKAVKVNHLIFASISEAGRFFKIYPGAVKKRINSLNLDWKYMNDITPQKTLIKNVKRIPVQIDGQLFASLAEAARVLNIPRRTVRYRCLSNRPRFTNWIILI
jgi:group I intron endonuclease